MYIPGSYAERDLPTLHAFLDAHPFAALVTSAPPDGLLATSLPLVLDRTAGAMGTLVGHFARANPHGRLPADTPIPALVIFTGPDAYITPSWYPAKAETGRVVPTWNYAIVHAYGTLRLRDDPAFLRAHLDSLTARHEAGRPYPWQVSDAPDDYIAAQSKAIIGVELLVDRLEGKWKMSQNRSHADIDGVIEGLGVSPAPRDVEVAELVRDRRPER